jgi:hypothetical protein
MLKLIGSSVVVLGQFNPAIVTPHWVVRNGLHGEAAGATELGLGASGQTLKHKLGAFAWVVTNQRFDMDSSGSTVADACSLVSGVLNLLSHTPVRAVGVNMTFEASADEATLDQLAPMWAHSLAAEFGTGESQMLAQTQFLLEPEQTNAQVQLVYSGAAMAIQMNLHRDVASLDEAMAYLSDGQRLEEIGRALAERVMELVTS